MATVTSSKRHLLVTSDTYTSNGDVVVGGDLTVSGSTTTLDTQNLIVEDKNIIIGQVATPTDTTADGGGLTLKGASDYTIAWNDSRNAWLFNQHLQPASDFSNDLGGSSYRWNAIYGGAGVFANSLTIGGNTAVTRTGVGNTGYIPVFSSNDNLVQSRIFQSSTGTYIHNSDSTTPLQITKSGTTFVKFIGESVINASQVEFPPGTESKPGLNFGRRNGTNANDNNTGIYSSAGDHVDIATGGSRRIGWDSAGTTLYTLGASTTDTDRFLVSDSGLIKYRTGSQIRSDIGAQPVGNYETDDGTQDKYIFRVDLGNLANVTRWYKVATVNIGNGGLLMRGSLTNHVESFGSTKFDLTIQGREGNASDEIEINGSIDVFDDNTGVYIVKSAVSGSYTTYDVYIECYNYTQAWVELIKTGLTTFDTSGNYVTTAPSGLVELDTSGYTEGSYTIIDSENRFSIKKINSGTTAISGNAVSNAVLRIGANYQNQIYMDGSTVYINDDMETERIYINTCDTNTTSTTALVLNGTEVEKRTLGSAAFANTGDFASSSHNHDSRYVRRDTATTPTNKITLGYGVSDLNSVGGGHGVTGFRSTFQASNRPGSGNYATGVEFTYHDTGARTQFVAASSGQNSTPELWVRGEHWGSTPTWGDWYQIYHENHKPTPAEIGAAASSHTHTWANIDSSKYASGNNNMISSAATGSPTSSSTIVFADSGGVNKVALSSLDLSLMDNSSSGFEQNVQANWNESSSSSDAFIQNKPTIPSGSQLVKVYTNQDYVASSSSTSNRGNFGAGLTVYEGYSTGANRPHTYDTTLQVMSTGSQGFEISADWVSATNTPLKVRSLRDCCQGWNPWTTIWTENNFSQTNINNWNTAYNNHITGIAVTGTTTKTITLTQNDGGTISANFTDQSGSAAETDTLATVTARGATTTTASTFNTITMNTPIVGSSAKIRFQNNDYIRFDDSANRFHFDVDGGTSNASVQAATFVGALSGNATSATNADTVDNLHAGDFLRSNAQDAYTPKRIDFGASSGWDAVGFGNQTNLHVQGHNQFWFGAGNGTWFEGTANTKSSTSGLAADASNAHDLLISTMQATAATDRGITFAVDSTGAGNDGWRLGKWHSSNSQASSKLTIDGGLHVRGGDMANYDYYADDYSTYWDNQAGGAYWTGDTGWIDPSITAGNAIQIQAGNAATNSNNPALQFHQYGYGGVQLRYDGPSDIMHLESTGSNRYDYFQNKTDHGYIQIGPMNTSHAHIYTDRSNFYFNKEIRVLGGCTVKQTEFSLGSGHKLIWNNGYGNPYIQDYYGSININAPVYIGAGGSASNVLYASNLYVGSDPVWHQGSTGLEDANRISTLSNANHSRPSGFYQASSGTNYPTTGTWYNLLNVRHSNTANDHGFQIAASYYNEDIFTRTYQGGSGNNDGSYTTWRRLYHEGHKPTLGELGAAASSHTHSAGDITSGTFSNRFSTGTRYSIGLTDGSTSQTRDKLRVWSGGTYTIGMKSGFSYGHLNDYAMSFQMNSDADRGWWWGDSSHTDAQGAMSLTTTGRLTVATSLSVGQGESVTSPSTEALYVSGSADVSTNVIARGHFYGRSVNGQYSNIYRMGGIYFTWDSDSYGTNTHHSIRSTYGDSYGDDLTINSYHHLRINIDSNNNNTDERFEIGQNTTGTGNVRFQVTGTGNVYASADVIAYYSFSDKRLKTNIKPTTNNLEKVLKLEPVEYTWKDGKRDGKKEIGLVAQDVEKIVPEVVRENRRLSDDDDTLYKQVDYEHLVSTLIGAVQEQQDQIELLKAEIKELKNK